MTIRVLLVDDDEFARHFARIVLNRAKCEVYEAEDVASALSVLDDFGPDVVVTDWNLPDGDGASLARQVHEKLASLPVILVTGDGIDLKMNPGTDLEFVSVLHKPYPPSSLERSLRSAIDRIPVLE